MKNMFNMSFPLICLAAFAYTMGCSPAVMLPPVQEPLDSTAWKNCAKDAQQRAGSALIDDLTMGSKELLCYGVVLSNEESKVDEAVEMLTEAAIMDKADYRAYFLSGRVLTRASRYEEALTAFARARKRNAQMEVPVVRLGNMVIEKNGDKEGVSFLQKVSKRGLCDFECKGLLAELYHRTDDVETATKLYSEMIEENVDDPQAYIGLARINNSEKTFKDEAKFLKKAIRTDGFKSLPNDKQAALLHSRAFALYNAEDYREAQKVLSKAMSYKSPAEWCMLSGWIQLKLSDPAMALVQFEKAIDKDKKLAPAYTGIGDASNALGQSEDAAKAYKQAAYLAPTDGIIKLKLAVAYIEMRDFDKAKIQLKDATKLGTNKLPKELLAQITDAIAQYDSKSGKR